MIRAEGIVLRTLPFRETSQVLTVYTRGQGKLKLIVKGARGVKPKGEGPVEPLQRIELLYYAKPRADMHLMTEWRVADPYPELRRDLDRMYAALRLVATVDRLTPFDQPQEAVYRLLADALGAISGQEGNGGADVYAEAQFLKLAGYLPRCDRCARCGVAAPGTASGEGLHGAPVGRPGTARGGDPVTPETGTEATERSADPGALEGGDRGRLHKGRSPSFQGDRWGFSFAEGGLLCDACFASKREGASFPRGVFLWLGRVDRTGAGIPAGRIRLSPELARQARNFLAAFQEQTIGVAVPGPG